MAYVLGVGREGFRAPAAKPERREQGERILSLHLYADSSLTKRRNVFGGSGNDDEYERYDDGYAAGK